MRCRFCGSSSLFTFKKVHGKEIVVCIDCEIGQLKNGSESYKDFEYLYNFDEYKKNIHYFTQKLKCVVTSVLLTKKSGAILEIGPGFGLLSSLLLKKGKYTLDVVEPYLTPECLKSSKYTLNKSNLDQYLRVNKKKFDIIIMMDVIEHLEDPFESLDKLRDLLNENGILVIQTPNYQSLMQYFVKEWSWWMVEDHRWFFSSKSFKATLKKHGFTTLQYRTYEDWSDFKKNLDGNFMEIKQPFRKLVKGLFFAFFYPFYHLLRPLFWKAGYGGLIFAIAKKDSF